MSVAEITFNRSVYSQLPGQEAFLRAQVVTVVDSSLVGERASDVKSVLLVWGLRSPEIGRVNVPG